MKSARRRNEAVLAALVAGAAVVLVVGAGVLYLGSTVNPVHMNAAAIPSAAADVDAGRYVRGGGGGKAPRARAPG